MAVGISDPEETYNYKLNVKTGKKTLSKHLPVVETPLSGGEQPSHPAGVGEMNGDGSLQG